MSQIVPHKCDFPGMLSESVDLLLKAADINFTLHLMPTASLNDALRLIANGTFHSFVAALTPTTERLRILQPSLPVGSWTDAPVAIGTIKAERDWIGKTSDFFNVYDPTIWTCAILLYLLAKLFRFVMSKLQNLNSNVKYRSELYCLAMLSFFSVYFAGLYKSGLLTHIILKRNVPQFEDFEELLELVKSGHVKLILPEYGPFLSMEQPNPNIKRLIESFDVNPPIYTRSFSREVVEQHAQDLRSGRKVAIGIDSGPNVVQSKMCGVRLVPLPTLGKVRNGLMFTPTVPESIIRRIDQAIVDHATVLLGIKQRYVDLLARVLNCSSSEDTLHRLEIYDCVGLFVLLIVGLIMSTLIAFVEQVVKIALDQRGQ